MNRGDGLRAERAGQQLAALLHQLEPGPHDRLRGGGAETDDEGGLDGSELRLEPRAARLDLRRARLLVDAPLPSRLPLEMLHRVGDIDLVARDAGVRERLVEHRAGGADKRLALPILLIARLLADEHHARGARAGAEHDLRGGLIQIAAAALMRRRAQRLDACRLRDKRRSTALSSRVGIIWATRGFLRHESIVASV